MIDARRAWVVEQYVYDPTGQNAAGERRRRIAPYYPAEQVSLPQKISLRLPTAGLALKIDMGTVQINRLSGDPAQLWTMPAFDGYQKIDLGGALPNTPLPGQPGSSPPVQVQPVPPPPTAQLTYPTQQVMPASYQAQPVTPLSCDGDAHVRALVLSLGHLVRASQPRYL